MAPTVTFNGTSFSQDASGATGARANYSANLVNGKVDTITRTTLVDRGRGYDVDRPYLYQHHQFKI